MAVQVNRNSIDSGRREPWTVDMCPFPSNKFGSKRVILASSRTNKWFSKFFKSHGSLNGGAITVSLRSLRGCVL